MLCRLLEEPNQTSNFSIAMLEELWVYISTIFLGFNFHVDCKLTFKANTCLTYFKILFKNLIKKSFFFNFMIFCLV